MSEKNTKEDVLEEKIIEDKDLEKVAGGTDPDKIKKIKEKEYYNTDKGGGNGSIFGPG